MIRAYIGLGSNLNDPIRQIKTALVELQLLVDSQFIQTSSLYRTAPLGPQDQPDFINAVVAVDTKLSALDLLVQLQGIENRQGRVRQVPWGPRTLDLDLLLYGNQCIDHPRLQVPHPGLKTREFVLYPLWELAGDLVLPTGELLQDLLLQCGKVAIKLPEDET